MDRDHRSVNSVQLPDLGFPGPGSALHPEYVGINSVTSGKIKPIDLKTLGDWKFNDENKEKMPELFSV